MDLATIDMPRAEARERYLEYRRAKRDHADAELDAIAAGYRAIAQGHAVINLRDTIAAGGLVDVAGGGRTEQLPALAVARASDRFATVATSTDGSLRYQAVIPDRSWRPRVTNRQDLRFPSGTLPGVSHTYERFRAVVPIIPPALRPAAKLERYHILWEAVWEPMPPVDPALLRHLRGDLYAVIAVWDLTPLEQAVLGHRFRELP